MKNVKTFLIVLAMVLFAAASVQAAELYWDPTQSGSRSTGGAGIWSDSTDSWLDLGLGTWSPLPATYEGRLHGTNASTVTLGSNVAANKFYISSNGGNVTLEPDAGGLYYADIYTLQTTADSTMTINAPISRSSTTADITALVFGAGSTITYNGGYVSDFRRFSKGQDGTMYVNSRLGCTDRVTVSGGVLDVSSYIHIANQTEIQAGTFKLTGAADVEVSYVDFRNAAGLLSIEGGTFVATRTSTPLDFSDYAGATINIGGGELVLSNAANGGSTWDWTALSSITDSTFLANGEAASASNLIFTADGGNTVITAVPEPATMGLLAMGGLALLRRKRK